MLEIDFKLVQNLGQQRDVPLSRTHDEFKEYGFRLDDVGEGLAGDLLLTDGGRGKNAVVIGQAGEKQIPFLLGQPCRGGVNERVRQQCYEANHQHRTPQGTVQRLLHRTEESVAVYHSMSRLGTSSSTVLQCLHM